MKAIGICMYVVEYLDMNTMLLNTSDEMMIFINNENANLMLNTYRK